MVQSELQGWRKEVNDFFHEARAELREIIAEVNQLIGQPDTMHEPISAAPLAPPREEPVPRIPAIAEAAADEGSDFSHRLDQLKRQLDQRLQEKPAQADEREHATWNEAS